MSDCCCLLWWQTVVVCSDVRLLLLCSLCTWLWLVRKSCEAKPGVGGQWRLESVSQSQQSQSLCCGRPSSVWRCRHNEGSHTGHHTTLVNNLNVKLLLLQPAASLLSLLLAVDCHCGFITINTTYSHWILIVLPAIQCNCDFSEHGQDYISKLNVWHFIST